MSSDRKGKIERIMLGFPKDLRATDKVKPTGELFPSKALVRKTNPYATALEIIDKLDSSVEYIFLIHPTAQKWVDQVIDLRSSANIIPIKADKEFSVWMEDPVEKGLAGEFFKMEHYRYNESRHKAAVQVLERAPIRDFSISGTPIELAMEGGNVWQDGGLLIGQDIEEYSSEVTSSSPTSVSAELAPLRGGSTAADVVIASSPPVEFDPRTVLSGSELNRLKNHRIDMSTVTPTPVAPIPSRPLPVRNIWYRNRALKQPMFHVDMFLTLATNSYTKKNVILIGKPEVGLAPPTPGDPMSSIYHKVAQGQVDLLTALIDEAKGKLPGGVEQIDLPMPLVYADKEVTRMSTANTARGHKARREIVRTWYFAGYNSCLMEEYGRTRNVYLPRYNNTLRPELNRFQTRAEAIWRGLGYTLHRVRGLHAYAQRKGGLDCIVKVLKRK